VPRIPRVGMVYPDLFCVIRPDGFVAMFRTRPEAIRWLRVEALERGRQTLDRRRRQRFDAIRQEVAIGVERDLWAEVLATDPRPPGPARTGGTPAA
jgi:hypothetical protein